MPFVKLLLHAVWSTYMRRPFLTSEIRPKVIEHILSNAESKNIKILSINGHVDYLHCLLSLSSDVSAAKVMQLLKGESSYWINKNNLTITKFEWADEYYVASISASDFSFVRGYIENQEEHHRTTTFEEEYQELIKAIVSRDVL